MRLFPKQKTDQKSNKVADFSGLRICYRDCDPVQAEPNPIEPALSESNYILAVLRRIRYSNRSTAPLLFPRIGTSTMEMAYYYRINAMSEDLPVHDFNNERLAIPGRAL